MVLKGPRKEPGDRKRSKVTMVSLKVKELKKKNTFFFSVLKHIQSPFHVDLAFTACCNRFYSPKESQISFCTLIGWQNEGCCQGTIDASTE